MNSLDSFTKNICNYIHTILREIISEDEEFDLCVSLFSDDYSVEDIAEFVMRKFLKNINKNFEFVTYHKNELNTIDEENTIIQEDIAQKSIDEEILLSKKILLKILLKKILILMTKINLLKINLLKRIPNLNPPKKKILI
jgi:hypothetical protein